MALSGHRAAGRGGPTLSRGPSIHPAIFELLYETAEAEKIPFAVEVSRGTTSTDADAVFNTPELRRAYLGGVRDRVPVGVSVGIQESPAALVDVVAGYHAAGYARIKLKIKPGKDVAYVAAVREAFPDVALMADANSAYTQTAES